MSNINEVTRNIVSWGEEKGIIATSNPNAQFIKAVSEMGELADAVATGTLSECEDAIGDTYVCLTLLAELLGTHVGKCIEGAYHEIKNRTGRMVNGVFVKNT